MKYLSVCSGIESASVAWGIIGWTPVAFSEIEKFPCAVLKHHYPDVPNLGDMTKFKEWPDYDFDILVGGTPCQSFSVAGLRKGLADPRGNLMLTYLAIANRYRPRILVWENVPGVLSMDKGRAFGTLIQGMEELGYHAAWRVLDAQYIRVDGYGRAVPQRRRRVFVVGYLGDWRRAAAILFDAESMSGNPPPSRKAGKGFAAELAPSLTHSGRGVERTGDTRGQDPVVGEVTGALTSAGGHAVPGNTVQDAMAGQLIAYGGNNTSGEIGVSTALNAKAGARQDFESETFLVSGTLRGEGFDGTDDGTRDQLVAFTVKDSGGDAGEISPTLRAGGHAGSHANAGVMPAIAIQEAAGMDNGGPGGKGWSDEGAAYTMEARHRPQMVAFQGNASASNSMNPSEISPTLDKGKADGMAVAFAQNQRDEVRTMDVAGALAAEPGAKQQSYAFQPRIARNGRGDMGDVVGALNAESGGTGKGDAAPCVAVSETRPINTMVGLRHEALGEGTGLGIGEEGAPAYTLSTQHSHAVQHNWAVRRLMPVECERLMGMPDNYTLIPAYAKRVPKGIVRETVAFLLKANPDMTEEEAQRFASHPDGPRYKALGKLYGGQQYALARSAHRDGGRMGGRSQSGSKIVALVH